MEQMGLYMVLLWAGFLGLVVGLIVLATIVLKAQRGVRTAETFTEEMRGAVVAMNKAHNALEKEMNEQLEKSYHTRAAQFKQLEADQTKTKEKIIEVINNSFDKINETFSTRLDLLEKEVAELKEEIRQ